MEKKTQRNILDLAALLVLCVYALCAIGVVLTGAKVYRNVTDEGSRAFDRRTGGQYVVSRLRQADCAGGISVETFGGVQALVIREERDGQVYLTRIYCHGGSLRELFSREEGSFSPEDGEELLPMEAMEIYREGNLMKVTLTFADLSERTLLVTLRSAEEVGA